MNTHKCLRFAVILTLALLSYAASPAPAFSQTRDLAAITGHVRDSQAGSLRGAEVILHNADTGFDRSTKTGEDGSYTFIGLPLTGKYSLGVRAANFAPAEHKDIALRAGETAEVDFTLNVAGTATQVTVYGTADGVQADSAAISTRLDLQKIENTPIANDRFTTLALLDSSVRPSFTTGDVFTNQSLIAVNGGGRRQTTYTIDNTTNDDSWGRQTVLTSLPYAALQEFTIVTNATSAEYGRTAGSAINVVTKSGTNLFHGDFIGMGRPAFSEASAPLAASKAENTLAHGSGAVAGPIIRDRTYFMVSAEYSSQMRDAVMTSPEGPPGAIFAGHFSQTLFLARVDHQFTPNHQLNIRANFDRFSDTNPQDGVSGINLPSAARTFSKRGYAASIGLNSSFGSHATNEGRFQWQLASPITLFDPQHPGPQVTLSGFYTDGESRRGDLMNHQYQWADTLTMARGRHILKGGFDVIWSSSGGFGQEFGSGFLLGQWSIRNPANCNYSSIPLAQVKASLQANPAGPPAGAACTGGAPPPLVNTYAQSFGNFTYNIKETLWGVFFQDDWKVDPRLTVNLGLRYEGQTFVDDHNNLAPRLGLAWQLPYVRATVLRAGYNLFYSEIRTDLGAGYSLNGPQGFFSFSAAPGACGFPTSFAPWPSIQAMLASPACSTGPAPAVPLRDITVKLGDAAYLNRFLNVSALRFYPDALVSPYTHVFNLGIEHEVAPGWLFSVDYVGTIGRNIERPADLNAPDIFARTAQNQTRSTAAANATRPVRPAATCTTASANFDPSAGNCFNNYRQVLAIVNLGEGNYNGLQLKLNKRLSHHYSMLLTYTWSHGIFTAEPDAANQNANDWNLLTVHEKATSILDLRHRAALSGWYEFPWGITFSSFVQLAAGLPYNVTTGTDNNGDGTNSDRPVINGIVVPRNWGQGTPSYDVSVALGKVFSFADRWSLHLRAETFNLFNHSNFYGRNGTFGNNPAPPATFGAPIGGIVNTGPGRQMQFMARIQF